MPKKKIAHRLFTADQKRAIGRQATGRDIKVADVAQEHGVSAKQVYRWRQKALDELFPEVAPESRECAHLTEQQTQSDGADDDGPDDACLYIEDLYAIIGEQHVRIEKQRKQIAQLLKRPA